MSFIDNLDYFFHADVLNIITEYMMYKLIIQIGQIGILENSYQEKLFNLNEYGECRQFCPRQYRLKLVSCSGSWETYSEELQGSNDLVHWRRLFCKVIDCNDIEQTSNKTITRNLSNTKYFKYMRLLFSPLAIKQDNFYYNAKKKVYGNIHIVNHLRFCGSAI